MEPPARWSDRKRRPKKTPKGTRPKKRKKGRLQAFAEQMKRHPTYPEKRLWDAVKGFEGVWRIRRQVIAAGFILDFANHVTKLAIEVDGAYHLDPQQMAKDAWRTKKLAANGWRVIRFPAAQVNADPWEVATLVLREIQALLP